MPGRWLTVSSRYNRSCLFAQQHGQNKGRSPGRASQLLDWYDAHARVLPWRARPGEAADPYRVWLSEIMLQQTTVQAVKAYFQKFVTLWPTVEALAAAPLDDVLKAWAGLGYYARARNLHACAKEVVARFGGRFPETEAELRSASRHRALYGGRHRGHRLRRAACGGRRQCRARHQPASTPSRRRCPTRSPRSATRAQALVPEQRAGRFRPGDDGPGRHHLHAADRPIA